MWNNEFVTFVTPFFPLLSRLEIGTRSSQRGLWCHYRITGPCFGSRGAHKSCRRSYRSPLVSLKTSKASSKAGSIGRPSRWSAADKRFITCIVRKLPEIWAEIRVLSTRRHWPDAGPMLGQRRRLWINIEPAFVQHLVFIFSKSPVQRQHLNSAGDRFT